MAFGVCRALHRLSRVAKDGTGCTAKDGTIAKVHCTPHVQRLGVRRAPLYASLYAALFEDESETVRRQGGGFIAKRDDVQRSEPSDAKKRTGERDGPPTVALR